MVIQVLAFGFGAHFRSREAMQELAEAGTNRITMWLNQTEGSAALTEMDEIARQVLPA